VAALGKPLPQWYRPPARRTAFRRARLHQCARACDVQLTRRHRQSPSLRRAAFGHAAPGTTTWTPAAWCDSCCLWPRTTFRHFVSPASSSVNQPRIGRSGGSPGGAIGACTDGI